MIKEAFIWTLLIVGGLVGYSTFNASTKDKEQKLIVSLVSLFVAIFCTVYFVFRFFYKLNQWSMTFH